MKGADVRICFIGDSFTAGVGDPEGLGWVGRVAAHAARGGNVLTTYNLGVRRETSRDIRNRWKREIEPRVMADADFRLVFCFGANDAAEVDGRRRVSLDETLSNARIIWREAGGQWPILLIGPPPVADEAHDQRIAELSAALATLAAELRVPYLDVFTPLMTRPHWRREAAANDGSHPRSAGYRELAGLITDWPEWWFATNGTIRSPGL